MYFWRMVNGNVNVAIVGGGAAGFFAAINLAEKLPAASIWIFEKSNQLLTKVKISGGGRCNVTHACFDPQELVGFYPRGGKELLGAFHRFAPGDIIDWFDQRGISLKIEEDGRMFPISDKSETIINCFLDEANKRKIKVEKRAELLKISPKGKKWELEINGQQPALFDALLIATGGSAKPKAYDFLATTGHKIIPIVPSLFTFNLPKHPSNELMGLSYEVVVRLKEGDYEESGPLLFTHWGMSGPAILKLSSKAAKLLCKMDYQFEFEVEWINDPAAFINKCRKDSAAQNIDKTQPYLMPQRLWLYLLKRAKVDGSLNWADLKKEAMESLGKTLGNDLYFANGKTTFKSEFVSCGGIYLKEIDFRNMESKLHSNLYFAGEVLDIDALTGGFNFQAAWTTAYIAAESIAKKFA